MNLPEISITLCAALAVSLMVAGGAQGKTYFVAPSGSDADEGTIEKPFRTIQRAADVMKPGDRCLVRTGIYRETVRPANSGVPGKAITFTPYPNETAVISGADPITGWQRDKGHIYKAPARWTRCGRDGLLPGRVLHAVK